MNPAVFGRPLIAIATALIILCLVILPFQPGRSPEFYITIISLVMNVLFLVGLMVWVRKGKGDTKK